MQYSISINFSYSAAGTIGLTAHFSLKVPETFTMQHFSRKTTLCESPKSMQNSVPIQLLQEKTKHHLFTQQQYILLGTDFLWKFSYIDMSSAGAWLSFLLKIYFTFV